MRRTPYQREKLRRFRLQKLRLHQTATTSCEIEPIPHRQTQATNEPLWQPSRAMKQNRLGITTPGSCSQAPQNQQRLHGYHETPWATFHRPDEKAILTLTSTLLQHPSNWLALPHPTIQSYLLSAKTRLNALAVPDAHRTQRPATSHHISPVPAAWAL